jgi:hypothetical protein
MPVAPGRRDWPRLLSDLVRQFNDGRIYDRDLPQVRLGLEEVLEAYHRRLNQGRDVPPLRDGLQSRRGRIDRAVLTQSCVPKRPT